jgi:hypothetical protein
LFAWAPLVVVDVPAAGEAAISFVDYPQIAAAA